MPVPAANPYDNPLLSEWTAPFGLPPFENIAPEHFKPAFDIALRSHSDEIATIADNPEPAAFPNTIDALERSGALLKRVSGTFYNLASALMRRGTPDDVDLAISCVEAIDLGLRDELASDGVTLEGTKGQD